MRKIQLLITTVSLLICLLPFNEHRVFANSVEDDFSYVDNQPNVIPYYPGGVTLTADLDSSRVDVVIPDMLGGKPINTIGVHAFQNKKLTSLNVSNNVKVIGSGAFQNNQLSSVNLSNQLEFIGVDAFANNNLQSITIPSSVIEIWDNSFAGNDLETITLLGSDTEIKQNSIPVGTRILGVIPSKAKDYADSNGFVFEEIGNKITYDGNGQTSGGVSGDYTGTTTNAFIVKNQGSLKKIGFTFMGWNTEQNGSGTDYSVGAVKTISGDLVLYAKWQVVKHEVTFNTNGGSTLLSEMVDYNTKAAEPPAPTKLGYTFDGWYTEASLTNRWDFTNDTILGNTTLYAKWVVKSSGGSSSPHYSMVYFESNGGDLLGNLSVAYDTKLAELPVPVKNGFTFGGWYKEAALINPWDLATDRVTEDTSLYAKWMANTTPEQPVMVFNDTIDHWAEEMIGELAGKGIITGYPDGSFHPNAFIQRQQVALLFYRAFEFEPTRQAAAFVDVDPNSSYYEAIMTLKQAGIVDGSSGQFNPTAFLTRAQMAKIMALALKLEPGEASTFQDVPATHWSYAYIAALAKNGIVLGDNGKFRPDEPVTRAEIVAMLYRALNLK